MFYKYRDTRRFVFLTAVLCIICLLLTTFVISQNTLDSQQDTLSLLQVEVGEKIICHPAEYIVDLLTLWDEEILRTGGLSSEQVIEDALITNCGYKQLTNTGYYSVKPKILAGNCCSTWYVKISIPDEYHISVSSTGSVVI